MPFSTLAVHVAPLLRAWRQWPCQCMSPRKGSLARSHACSLHVLWGGERCQLCHGEGCVLSHLFTSELTHGCSWQTQDYDSVLHLVFLFLLALCVPRTGPHVCLCALLYSALKDAQMPRSSVVGSSVFSPLPWRSHVSREPVPFIGGWY